MHQVIQNIRTGQLNVMNVPVPSPQPGQVLIANSASVISAGTEKMVMDLASKSLLGKAKDRPDHVRRVLQKIRQDGIASTLNAVRAKLSEPMAMGYASAGTVIAVGDSVEQYKPGDRVASNGPHAGVVNIPKHLCARIPESVPFEHAAFAVIGSIAMQGVRLSGTGLGETAFVIGLGLVGQLTVAILKAAGCRVIGTDLDPEKCELALKMGAVVARPGVGAEDIESLTGGMGADAVLITASTKSNQPIELAANAVRQKGRVVLVGVVGLELDRRPFYFKEAEFVVSCSYGPGRYDPNYEQGGHDYPAGYVRWTEQRNMQSVLDLMASGALDVAPLITHRFSIENAGAAYEMIEKGGEPYVGIVLEYPIEEVMTSSRVLRLRSTPVTGKIGFAMLGAGNFARTTLLPAIASSKAFQPIALCTSSGMNAQQNGDRAGFDLVSTDVDMAISTPNVSAVFVMTRHNLHAPQVIKALRAGKHVFVEKPLCLNLDELSEIENVLVESEASSSLLMVGFNRRFAPAVAMVKTHVKDIHAPLTVSIRFNAGDIPADHWTQDIEIGGGRIIGEACHAIDLATHLVGSRPVKVYAESIGGPDAPKITDDQCFITLRHANGSISNIAYQAGGDRAFGKERVEVLGGGRVAVIDDFREVTTVARGRSKKHKMKQDKGHGAEIRAFAKALSVGDTSPISWSDLRSTTLASILAVKSLRTGMPQEILA